jgi:uncharacterized membrane protein
LNFIVHLVSHFALALLFIIAGTAHFSMPAPYLAIMPPHLPWPAAMVALSAAAEILGGLGICFRATRAAAGWALIALWLSFATGAILIARG